MTDSKKERYLAFVDYLGTRELYRDVARNAALLEDRRYELEHGVHFRLQSAIAEKRIEVGVFSDTILIAGRQADDVLLSAVQLFAFVLQKTLTRADGGDIRLLRGGIAHGRELRSSYLKPGLGVSAIPFFDGSLAFAYELEDVRRGSRLFLDPNIGTNALGANADYGFAWQQMTGHGRAVTNIREFLWPAKLYADKPGELCALLDNCMALWRKTVAATAQVDPDRYRATLYHFDETIKLVIRSFVAFRNAGANDAMLDALVRHLPRPEDAMEETGIRYVWGIWFQIMYVIVRFDAVGRYHDRLLFLFSELKRRYYFANFVAETDCPDYEVMVPFVRQLASATR